MDAASSAAQLDGAIAPQAPDPETAAASATCYHCGVPNLPATRWTVVLDGTERRFCCAGCLAVAQTIRAAGLAAFYTRRSAPTARPTGADDWTQYDAAAEAAGWTVRVDADLRETSLLLEGIQCAACVWLNEAYLRRQPGIVDVSVNFATRRARVRWDARKTLLSDLLRAIAAIGYRAYPYDPARREALARRESRSLLIRMSLALLAMMQVMMFAVPAYISVDGVEPQFQVLLGWASLALTLPVVLYSAVPFFLGALRDLRRAHLGMNVPVALGVGGAFVASAWATLIGSGPVYYDSVTMFVALLLCARYVELRARQRAAEALETIAHDLPASAERVPRYPADMTAEVCAAAVLAPGDIVRVPSGAVIPADGKVCDGRSSVEEAVLTGESWPRAKAPGDAVLAGSINRESPLIIRVTAAGHATALAQIARLVERAANERPRVARLADRAAQWFVGALLLVAFATGLWWWHIDPARALAVTFAVLVVSCPCALSLATPAVLAAAVGTLGRRHILAVRGHALETLARVTHVVFDKTGTLTTGNITLLDVALLGALDREACIALAAALEQGSRHPIAKALPTAAATAAVGARAIAAVPGAGVEGAIRGRRYRFGRPDWVAALHGQPLPSCAGDVAPDATAIALADQNGWLAWFAFGDALRPGAPALVAALRERGVAVALLSGDRTVTATRVAQSVGIAEVRGDATPEDKREYIAAMQRKGAIVAMIGDGINDAPSLAQADVSLSLGSAAMLTQWTADIVVLGDDIGRIADALAVARRAFHVIRQNLAWALAYNAVAIPLAATGALTPLAAAVGMSASSMLVVANALRLARRTLRSPGSVRGQRRGVAAPEAETQPAVS